MHLYIQLAILLEEASIEAELEAETSTELEEGWIVLNILLLEKFGDGSLLTLVSSID